MFLFLFDIGSLWTTEIIDQTLVRSFVNEEIDSLQIDL